MLGVVDRYIADVLPGLPTSEALFEDADDPESLMRLSHMEKHDGFFASWYHDARFTGAAAALLGDDIVYTSVQLFDKPPRLGKITPPHQDGFYFMLEPNEAITLWISLHPSDGQNGCMHFVAGSHRRGIRPHQRSNVLGFSQGITDFGADDEAAEVAVDRLLVAVGPAQPLREEGGDAVGRELGELGLRPHVHTQPRADDTHRQVVVLRHHLVREAVLAQDGHTPRRTGADKHARTWP